jgi:hypothetical protein
MTYDPFFRLSAGDDVRSTSSGSAEGAQRPNEAEPDLVYTSYLRGKESARLMKSLFSDSSEVTEFVNNSYLATRSSTPKLPKGNVGLTWPFGSTETEPRLDRRGRSALVVGGSGGGSKEPVRGRSSGPLRQGSQHEDEWELSDSELKHVARARIDYLVHQAREQGARPAAGQGKKRRKKQGKKGAKPATGRSKKSATPTGERGKQGATPAAERARQAATPAAERARRGATPAVGRVKQGTRFRHLVRKAHGTYHEHPPSWGAWLAGIIIPVMIPLGNLFGQSPPPARPVEMPVVVHESSDPPVPGLRSPVQMVPNSGDDPELLQTFVNGLSLRQRVSLALGTLTADEAGEMLNMLTPQERFGLALDGISEQQLPEFKQELYTEANVRTR